MPEVRSYSKDPDETRNVATLPAYSSVLGDLQTRLAKHLRDTSDPILDGAVTNPMHRRALEWLKS